MKAKKRLISGLMVLVGVAAGAGAAAAYYWNRATALPTWYTRSDVDGNALATTVGSGESLLRDKLASGEDVRQLNNQQVAITLSETDINQLIQTRVAQSPTVAPLVAASQGIKATIEGNQLQAGMVINPSQVPLDHLPDDTQTTVKQALEALPMLGDRDLYLGITGRPSLENGRLVLGPDTRLQVGNVTLSLPEVARMTGLSSEDISRQINLALPQVGLTLDSLEFTDGEAILQGRPE